MPAGCYSSPRAIVDFPDTICRMDLDPVQNVTEAGEVLHCFCNTYLIAVER